MGNKSLLWGADLYRGATVKNNPNMMRLSDFVPYQMLHEDEKTPEWLKAVANHYEAIGWRNVLKRKDKIQRNYWLRHGRLNMADYMINPTQNDYYKAVSLVNCDANQSPLEMFYPLIPNYVDVLRGEFIKRDNTFQVEQIDSNATVEALQFKEDKITEILEKIVVAEKQKALAKAGITPSEEQPEANQKYEQAIQEAITNFRETEASFKKFRTIGAKWAAKVSKIQESRYNLQELEPEAFECGLITDSEFWHINLLEDDFKLELLNPKWCDYHKGPGTKYVSDGDYFLWFDWGSSGDIINTYGKIMSEKDILNLKNTYSSVLNSIIVPDHEKAMQGSYYDASQPYKTAVNLNAPMNDSILGKELAFNFSESSNFQHSIFDPASFSSISGDPQMFRIMNLYFRGMKRLGWLTTKNREGILEYQDWVDDNWKQTIQPKYDHSLVKEKTVENLIYGEHVEWTWVTDWRHLIKISANNDHSFWKNNPEFQEIFLDGSSVRFQFKGKNNPFESKPPVEGCVFSYLNATSHSFVDRLKPYQIIFNIAMNKVPKQFLKDYGLKITIDNRIIPSNSNDLEAGISPLEAYDDKLRNSDVLDYKLSRESLEGLGQPALPQILNLSTAEQAMAYLKIAQEIKAESGEVVGITRNRLGNNKASETAYGVQQGIQYSETQTEKYFEQHSQLMERVRQRMLDAAQYYSTFKDTSREIYMNEKEENEFLEIEGMQNLLPHYNIRLKSTANIRATLKTLSDFLINENTLPFRASDKIQAIVSRSIPEIVETIKKGDVEAEQNARREQEAKQQMEQQRIQSEEKRIQDDINYKTNKDLLDRESNEKIAEIRALGGLQSDEDMNSVPDARDNMDYLLKQQTMNNNVAARQSELDQKQAQHVDKMLDKQADRSSRMELEKEKLKLMKEMKRNVKK